MLVQSNTFVNFTGDDPNGIATFELSHAGPTVYGVPAVNFVMTSNYFNGSVFPPFNPDKSSWTNITDGMLTIQSGGNVYVADNLIKNYTLEALEIMAGPVAVVRNQYITPYTHGPSALAFSYMSTNRSFTHSPDDLAFYFIGNTVTETNVVVMGNLNNYEPYNLTVCGNEVDGRLVVVDCCGRLNCSGNLVRSGPVGVQLYLDQHIRRRKF